MVRRMQSSRPEFGTTLSEISDAQGALEQSVIDAAEAIIRQVRHSGDVALVELTQRFDRRDVTGVDELRLSQADLAAAVTRLSESEYDNLNLAAERIRWFHENQKQDSWQVSDELGNTLGQRVLPLDSVGVYVPGGKASYPSSVLMNVIPAKVAGVPRVVMVSPSPDGEMSDWVLAAAHLAGVDEVITIGGAQAVAALAYGTESIKPVDKIVGPGNAYVAAAKRAVFGQVGIDMIAGPSEILVICDGQTDPDWVAMDLFSQAEHDEDAQSILLCPDADYLKQVEASIEKLLPTMQRREIIETALRARGALIQCRDMDEAAKVSNFISPEHLELSVAEPDKYVDKIKHAGAIFMGRHTCESLGDYCAGPNHVLPTSRTARFSSPLGVYDFQKRSSLIMVSDEGSQTLGRTASILARGEGLEAHARSAEYRLKD